MGAVPKRKISKQRKRNRRSHYALKKPMMDKCPTCKNNKLPHVVCENCGTYNGVQVLKVE